MNVQERTGQDCNLPHYFSQWDLDPSTGSAFCGPGFGQFQVFFRIGHDLPTGLSLNQVVVSKKNMATFKAKRRTPKRVTANLAESEQRFRTVWEISADAMALSDREGIVLEANRAYYRLYG